MIEYGEGYANGRKTRGGILGRLPGRDRRPIEQQIDEKKRGVIPTRRPYVMWTLTTIMVSVFIYETVKNYQVTGAPVSFCSEHEAKMVARF